MPTLRSLALILRHTPFHPQWLLGRRKPPAGIEEARGLLLDIGAADRWIARFLPDGTEYVALDYPVTGDKFYGTTPDVFADACHLPLGDACADNVVCLEVLEHVPDPAAAVMEIARVLKPGGRAWLSMPFMYPVHNEPFDFQRYTEFGLRRDLGRANLEVVELARPIHSVRTAGLLMSLALAGGIYNQGRIARLLLVVPGVVGIFAVNVTAWLTSLAWPSWGNLTMRHDLRLRKGQAS